MLSSKQNRLNKSQELYGRAAFRTFIKFVSMSDPLAFKELNENHYFFSLKICKHPNAVFFVAMGTKIFLKIRELHIHLTFFVDFLKF